MKLFNNLRNPFRFCLMLAILAVLGLVLSGSSCRQEKAAKPAGSLKTVPATYKTLWQFRDKIKFSDVIYSAKSEKVLATSLRNYKVILLSKGKKLWEKDFPNFYIKRAALNNDSSRALLFLDTNLKSTGKRQKKKLVLLGENGQIIFEKSFLLKDGFFNIYLSSKADKIVASFYPEGPNTNSFLLVLDGSGKELFKKEYKDSTLLFEDVSKDFKRILTGVTFSSTKNKTGDASFIVGYKNESQVFKSSPQKGSISGRFLSDDNFYALASSSNTNKELSVHKWAEGEALWKQKKSDISSVQTARSAGIILARSHTGVSSSEGTTFLSKFYLFTDKGKKLWDYERRATVLYDSKLSSDGKKLVLTPFGEVKEPALLFVNLKKDALPQKLPANTIAADFAPNSNFLAVATSSGYVKLLEIN